MEPRAAVYSVKELCAILKMGERQVREALIRGEIPAKVIGKQYRVPVGAFHRWLDEVTTTQRL